MSERNPADNSDNGGVIPLWRTTSAQRQFSSWTSGLGADGGVGDVDSFSGLTGRDLLENMPPSDDQDADIFSVAYKKGWEDGQTAFGDEHVTSNQKTGALAEAIQHLNDLSSRGSYTFILSAVESLFRRCAELAIPDPGLLQAWALQLAELVDQDQKGVTLVLHPDDVSLIDGNICKLALRGDGSMLRGNLKLSHSGGWIEKGSEVVLDELRTLIDEFSGTTSAADHD
ncbi:hypothetical protein [Parasphingorhabdus halotolerans]|uniref:Flagellar assembly protein FliH n=1 Tax=Parasphingorhabdus halotolerans TaxID=2725558 RepID=A0A6H2DI08_9SPHN|nr:hypothetical protein [Parasphingorhabdus halotolerans]QJB68020.1 hypothetical protein HF685_00775 [Parasphingorhabdus halotolerans]